MPYRYILDGHTPVPCEDLQTWGRWYEDTDRHVGDTEIGGVHISTVFLGLDHNFGADRTPILFETMIFGGMHDGDQERYSSWEAAEAGHQRAVARVRADAQTTDVVAARSPGPESVDGGDRG